MMLTLYMHPISTVSRPISLFIAEKELPVTEKVLDLMAGEHKGAGYLAINPNGQVPSLVVRSSRAISAWRRVRRS
jgi:glutathione S-transferase